MQDFFSLLNSLSLDEISSAVVILPDRITSYSSGLVRAKLTELLLKSGKKATLLPRLTTLYDLAKEFIGLKVGEEIREADFSIILRKKGGKIVPERFLKKKNSSYRKYLLQFLDQLSLVNGDFTLLNPETKNDLKLVDLSSEVVGAIYKLIRAEGYLFLGDIYYHALTEITNSPERFNLFNYYLLPGGFYSKIEKQILVKILGDNQIIQELEPALKWQPFINGLNGSVEDFSGLKLNYLKATSPVMVFEEIFYHILMKREQRRDLKFSDFTILCQSSDTIKRGVAFLTSQNVPVAAALTVKKESFLALALQAISLGEKGDLNGLVTFFNLYCQKEALVSLELAEEVDRLSIGELLSFLKDPNQAEFTINFIRDGAYSPDFNKFVTFLELFVLPNLDEVLNLHELFSFTSQKLRSLFSLFKVGYEFLEIDGYRAVVAKLFGNELTYRELLDYLLEIGGGGVGSFENDFSGVNVVSVKDLISPTKIIYLVDLEEDLFLNMSNLNPLFERNQYLELEKLIYQRTKGDYLISAFNATWQDEVEEAILAIPAYNEATIVSTKIDALLNSYPFKEGIVVTNGKDILGKFDFPYSMDDLLNEKAINPLIKEDKIVSELENTLSFEYSLENLKQELNSASKIESFLLCPAHFVAQLKSDYHQIESVETFKTGRFFHEVVQNMLLFFRGKDLLTIDKYSALVDLVSSSRAADGFSDSTIREIVNFYFDNEELSKGLEIVNEIIYLLDDFGLRNIFNEYITLEKDLAKSYLRQKEVRDIFAFILRFLVEIGPTPKEVTGTFLIELYFGNFTLLPGVVIKSGYLDFVMIDQNRTIRLYDFKSGSLREYAKEINSKQIVQLLIYKEVFFRAILTKDFSSFHAPESFKNERVRDFLTDDYQNGELAVRAFYLSSKDLFKVEAEFVFEQIILHLNELLSREKFSSIANHQCRYCFLNSGCDKSSQSQINLTPYYEKGFVEESEPYQNFSILPEVKKSLPSTSPSAEYKVVQFAKGSDQAKAVSLLRENIVISAGAGAGKTEVLSARYLNLLINEDEVELKNIVCITFTNKAVGEMKKRIFQKLKDAITTKSFFTLPKDDGAYQLSEEQLNKLIRTKTDFFINNRITTFHAFCKQLLDRYGHLSQADYDLENETAFDYVIKDYQKELIFREHQNQYQNYLKECSLEEKNRFLAWLNRVEFYRDSSFGSSGFLNSLIKLVNKIILTPQGFNPKLGDSSLFTEIKSLIIQNELKSSFDDEVLKLKSAAKKVVDSLYADGLEDDKRVSSIEKIIEQINNLDFSFNGTNCKKSKKDSVTLYTAIEALFDLKKEVEKHLYLQVKRCNDGDEALIYKAIYSIAYALYLDLERFKTEQGIVEQNDFHSRLINLLTSNTELCAKISAECKYFLLDEFQDTNWLQDRLLKLLFRKDQNYFFIVGDLKQSIYRFQQCDNSIFRSYISDRKNRYLSFKQNFRSVAEIVSFNNYFFSKNINDNYNIFPNYSQEREFVEFAIPVRKGGEERVISLVQINNDQADGDDKKVLTDQEINQLIKIKEAEFIAQSILKNSHQGFESFGILIRSYSKIDYLLETLKKYHIPYSFTIKRGLLSSGEVVEFVKILKVIHQLLSSVEIEYIPNISQILIDLEPFYEGELYYLAFQLLNHPLMEAYQQRDVEYRCRRDNLITLIELIGESDNLFISHAQKFIHLDKLAKEDSVGMETDGEDAVKIMTVHSSKGLEFENLFLVNVGEREVNSFDLIEFVNLPPRAGEEENFVSFGLKSKRTFGDKSSADYWFNLYLKKINQNLDEMEAANLLYVAFTRAKNNLFVTMLKTSSKNSDGSEVNWLKNIEGNLFADLADKKIKISYLGEDFFVKREVLGIGKILAQEGVGQGKITVLKDCRLEAKPLKIKEDNLVQATNLNEDKSGLVVGSLVHKFLEDEIRVCYRAGFNLEKVYNRLLVDSGLDSAVINRVKEYLTQIMACSEFASLVLSAKRVVTEQPLAYFVDGITTYGVVDLLLIFEEKIMLIDYKTTNSEIGDELFDKYKKQLLFYETALKELFVGMEIEKRLLVVSKKRAYLIEN